MTNLDIFASLYGNNNTNYISVGEFITAMIGMLTIFVAVLGIMLVIFRESQKDAGLQRSEIRNITFQNQIMLAQLDAKLSLLLIGNGISFEKQQGAADQAKSEIESQQNYE